MKNKFFLFLLFISSNVFAAQYDIEEIKPVFNESTPFFGEFKVLAKIKNNGNSLRKISVACLYVGLTRPGVYYKNEPKITKQYKAITIESKGVQTIEFSDGFRSYHPEVRGELIISIIGTGIIKSEPLRTRFHPGSND
jgi:hypothetical protein